MWLMSNTWRRSARQEHVVETLKVQRSTTLVTPAIFRARERPHTTTCQSLDHLSTRPQNPIKGATWPLISLMYCMCMAISQHGELDLSVPESLFPFSRLSVCACCARVQTGKSGVMQTDLTRRRMTTPLDRREGRVSLPLCSAEGAPHGRAGKYAKIWAIGCQTRGYRLNNRVIGYWSYRDQNCRLDRHQNSRDGA